MRIRNKILILFTLCAQCALICRGQLQWNADTLRIDVASDAKVATGQFICKNISDKPITILDCRPSCDCVAIEWPKLPIGAGKMASFNVTFQLHKNTEIQKQQMDVIFETSSEQALDNEQSPSKTLYIEARLQQNAFVKPGALFWKRNEEKSEKFFEIYPRNGLSITKVDIEPNVNSSFTQTLRSLDNGKYRLVVSAREGENATMENFDITIYLNDGTSSRKILSGIIME